MLAVFTSSKQEDMSFGDWMVGSLKSQEKLIKSSPKIMLMSYNERGFIFPPTCQATSSLKVKRESDAVITINAAVNYRALKEANSPKKRPRRRYQ